MQKKVKTSHNYIKGIILAACFFFVLEIIVFLQIDKIEEQERLISTEKLIEYKNEIDLLFSKYIYLIQGFSINIENELENEDIMYIELEQIFNISDSFINNIGIIKDTTLVYNYPIDKNKATLGVDLSFKEGQKQYILEVKNDKHVIVQGPVELIQGGSGFILRIPIMQNKEYWGQVGLVFKEEQFEKNMIDFASKYNLNVSVSIKDGNKELVNTKIEEYNKPLSLEYTAYNLNWVIMAEPEAGWDNYLSYRLIGTLIVIIITLTITWFYIRLLNVLNQITFQANHDELTGAYNRFYLNRKLNEVISDYTKDYARFAVLNLDIDNFKSINDKHGHQTGDYVLVAITKTLRFICPKESQVFRVGGDEFVVILYNLIDIENLISTIDEYLKSHSIINDLELFISLSIGYSVFPNNGASTRELLHHADSRMYEMKRSKKKIIM